MSNRIVIIGGGLAGLLAAYRLEQAGQDYLLLEARERFGGRLHTVSAPNIGSAQRRDAFDLGATWYWPAMQQELDSLVRELGLQTFVQTEQGDLVVEGQPGRVRRMQGFASAPASMRLTGGMSALIEALRSRLPAERLLLEHSARGVALSDGRVTIESQDPTGVPLQHEFDRVLIAMPPRLAQATVRFEPPLPDAVASQWAETATWMAPHAKYLAVYQKAFWRERGLSGGARSQSGPLVEVHDASSTQGAAALFGFIGLPVAYRRKVPEQSLREMCRAQLVRLFGDEAAVPVQDWIQDWSQEPFTATAADVHPDRQHGEPAAQVGDGAWDGRLVGIASEWSRSFPGYVAGAVEAAGAGVTKVLPANERSGSASPRAFGHCASGAGTAPHSVSA
jgi:monoamine oxidase